MNKIMMVLFCVIATSQGLFGAVASIAKGVGARLSAKSIAASGAIFQGMTERGVTKNTFLCGDHSVTESLTKGSNVEASDCSISIIRNAIGLDVSGGKTVQFFNNFTYWLRQKSQEEQDYQINHPSATDSDVAMYMQSNGWNSMGAYCILVSTNEILQKVVGQKKQANAGEIKVVVQLWYNGDNLIQLWSQDVAIMQPGQKFTIVISNDIDDNLSTMLQESSSVTGYLSAAGNVMQSNNRNENNYASAAHSPRMVRIQVGLE